MDVHHNLCQPNGKKIDTSQQPTSSFNVSFDLTACDGGGQVTQERRLLPLLLPSSHKTVATYLRMKCKSTNRFLDRPSAHVTVTDSDGPYLYFYYWCGIF
ncbi:hypothetical protein CEXT_425191 [Caerostris extrusa]|uniref:Uncharacterized protein n=1 Tax=Caerostris extrusa TaxID=172846 RepID=A0AAV4QYV3_CAEEX|nr:hypothetical protein CEXT_425191 [Caerostris extrusa]